MPWNQTIWQTGCNSCRYSFTYISNIEARYENAKAHVDQLSQSILA